MTYSALQLDGLKEIMNIGGGHAATSISQLVNKPINMHVPEIKILTYQDLYQQIISDDTEVYAAFSQVIGDLPGAFLFVLGDRAANQLSELMLGDSDLSAELKTSALNELTNIITNSFLNAIANLVDKQLIASLPQVQYDFFGAVISSTYMALDQYDEQIMVIRNEFIYEEERLDASLFFIPQVGVLEQMLDALGI